MTRLFLFVVLAAGCSLAGAGRAPDVSEATCPPGGGQRDLTGSVTFDSSDVDRDAQVSPDTPPLRSSIEAGHVVARFVIDSTGLADLRTLSIEPTPDTALAQEVRAFMPQARFIPAQLHGCRVRVWARWPFDILSGREVET